MSYDKIYKAMQSAINDNKEITRRRFPRRMRDICVVNVNEKTYPVRDWSQCGVLFEADGRMFEAGTDCQVVMKFKIADVVTEISVTGQVARAGKKQVALEFANLSEEIQNAFDKVIEDALAQPSDESEKII